MNAEDNNPALCVQNIPFLSFNRNLAIILLAAPTYGFSSLETSMCQLIHCKLLTDSTFKSVVSSTGATCLRGL